MTERREKIASHHIQKTGGTTVESFLIDLFGKPNVIFYHHLTGTFIRTSETTFSITNPIIDALKYYIGRLPLYSFLAAIYIKSTFNDSSTKGIKPQNLPDDYRAIHGHQLAKALPHLFLNHAGVVVIREPLERAASHYSHWKRIHGQVDPLRYNPAFGFEDFALHPNIINYQSKTLGSLKLDDFEFVGVTEELGQLEQKLSRAFGETGPKTPRVRKLNRSGNRFDPYQQTTEAFRTRFRQLNDQDYALYEEAQERVVKSK